RIPMAAELHIIAIVERASLATVALLAASTDRLANVPRCLAGAVEYPQVLGIGVDPGIPVEHVPAILGAEGRVRPGVRVSIAVGAGDGTGSVVVLLIHLHGHTDLLHVAQAACLAGVVAGLGGDGGEHRGRDS